MAKKIKPWHLTNIRMLRGLAGAGSRADTLTWVVCGVVGVLALSTVMKVAAR